MGSWFYSSTNQVFCVATPGTKLSINVPWVDQKFIVL